MEERQAAAACRPRVGAHTATGAPMTILHLSHRSGGIARLSRLAILLLLFAVTNLAVVATSIDDALLLPDPSISAERDAGTGCGTHTPSADPDGCAIYWRVRTTRGAPQLLERALQIGEAQLSPAQSLTAGRVSATPGAPRAASTRALFQVFRI
jgi:hypothetical protein